MFLRRLTDFILLSRSRAAVVAFFAAFLPIPGGSFGVLVASLVTLRKGAFEGSLIFTAAISASFVGYLLFRTPETAWLMSLTTRADFALSILTWLLVLVLRVFSSWSLVLECGALIGLFVIMVLHWVFPTMQTWWVQQLTAYFQQAHSQIGFFLPASSGMHARIADIPPAILTRWIQSISYYATGFLVTSFLCNTVLQVVMARAWECFIFMPGQLRQELYGVRLGAVVACAMLLLLILNGIGNRLALDMLPVLMWVFFLAGLSLTHAILAKVRGGWIGLLLVYLGIVTCFPFSLFALAIPGLLDVWLDFRKRIGAVKK